jgi:hypothetical protein
VRHFRAGSWLPIVILASASAVAQSRPPGTIAIGQLVQGDLDDDEREPYRDQPATRYTFEAVAGQHLEIILRSEDFDCYLHLEDPSGTRIGENDDGAGNQDSRILTRIPLDGLYTIIASAYSDEGGAYELLVREFHPLPVTFDTLSVGTPVEGDLSDSDGMLSDDRYSDGFFFSGDMGARVQIDLTSGAFDTYLILVGPTGEVMAENDDLDVAVNTDSRISLLLPYAGDYQLLATSYGASALGPYRLELSILEQRRVDFRDLDVGDRVDGDLDSEDGVWVARGTYADGYDLEVTEEIQVEITLESSDFDAYLYLIGPDGDIAGENDDSDASLDSRMVERLDQEGTYRIIATSYELHEGAYTLSIEERRTRALEARVIEIGATIAGELTTDDPMGAARSRHFDPYELDLVTDQHVVFTMRSTEVDSGLRVNLPSGELLRDDNSGGGLDAMISLVAPFDGTYLVVATTGGSGALGHYELAVTAPGAIESETQLLEFGAVVAGQLAHDDAIRPGRDTYRDLYQFEGEAGRSAELLLTATTAGLDPYLLLIGPAGDILSANDDGGGGLDSRIQIELPDSGRYTVIVTTYQPAVGGYDLALSELEPVVFGTVRVTVGDVVSGELGSPDPRSTRYGTFIDTYTLAAAQGERLRITMVADGFDPFLAIVDPNGETILYDDDGGGGWNARIDFSVGLVGSYRILATSASSGVGAYTIEIESGSPSESASPFSQP